MDNKEDKIKKWLTKGFIKEIKMNPLTDKKLSKLYEVEPYYFVKDWKFYFDPIKQKFYGVFDGKITNPHSWLYQILNKIEFNKAGEKRLMEYEKEFKSKYRL